MKAAQHVISCQDFFLSNLSQNEEATFHFLHISKDEVAAVKLHFIT